MKKLLSTALALCMAFSCFAVIGAVPSYAASKPAKVSGLKSSAVAQSSAKLSWKKAKGSNGYQIVLNGKAVANTKSTSYTLGGLNAGTKYSVKVRAYKSYKQYYNTKKKKWVSKKPKASQWKTKKTRTKYKYGKYSSTISFKTKAAPAAPVNINYPSLDQARSETLATINAYRKARGATTVLEFEETANRVAQKKAEYMASVGKVDYSFPALGGEAWDMLLAEGKEVWNCDDVYAANITSFDSSIVSKTDNAVGDGMSGSFKWAESNPDGYNAIGIGYCRGYLEIVFVQYAYDL